MIRTVRLGTVGVFVTLLLSAGCFSFGGKAAPPVDRYQLAYPAPSPVAETLPATLRVVPLRTAAAYDRTDIVYREGAHRLGTYNYERWAVQPGRMIGDLIGRDLAVAKLFRAMLQGPSPLTADFILGGFVEEIDERVDEGCSAHLRIRFTLTHRTERTSAEPLYQQSYEADEPCAGRDTEDLVEAMSGALASISERLRNDLAEIIGSRR